MMSWFNSLMRTYLGTKYRRLLETLERPIEQQTRVLESLTDFGAHTEYGERFGLKYVKDAKDFARQLPVVDYEMIRGDVLRMMHGEENVLWPGQVTWFTKSSGTTSSRSKFIPIPHENLKGCHNKSSWAALALLYEMLPEATVFYRKNLIMGGSLSVFEDYPDTTYGDVSAIMMQHMPAVGRPFFTPDFTTALLDNWEEKLERMTKICTREDVSMIGGVPTWTIVLFNRILEYTGKEHMLEVWPNLQAYTHGGVGFEPYRKTFEQFIPSQGFLYQQVYNASEGFFAAQDIAGADDMLLFVDHGMYFEFLPQSEWSSDTPVAIPLSEVETGVPYALVITTNAGLWRYKPGDSIMFTSTDPYRIQVVGRTQQYINAFGEEVMIANAEKALASACKAFGAEVADYTVAPFYLGQGHKGHHDWLIEFRVQPADLSAFADHLDEKLMDLNSDYAAKRSHSLALERLTLKPAPRGTFEQWMASKNRLGGQNKVPRLSNDRRYLDEILAFINNTNHHATH